MSWVGDIITALEERDEREKGQEELVIQYGRLAKETALLRQRNTALLQAATITPSSTTPSSGPATDNPVRAAFLASLETQLTQTRHELSEQYKIQSSNSQRLLALTDNLRQVEARSREEREELSSLRREVEGLREKAGWHKEVVAEKERQLLILQDDHASLTLELNQLSIQNDDLKVDNSSLLQRWIESKNDEASRMNEANTWMNKLPPGPAAP